MSQTDQQRRIRPHGGPRRWLTTSAYFVAGIALGTAGLLAIRHPESATSIQPSPANPRAYAYVQDLLSHSKTPLLKLPHRNWFVVTQNGRRMLVVVPRGEASTAHLSRGVR